ncbi:MAG: IS110 family transposase [Oscillospiraceae bacterium]|nr:IS110 family transposase [Oscillospiraceae bacterium]
MNFTQNEKISQVSEETLVIGIDIASETHYARAFDWRGIELWPENTSIIRKSHAKIALDFKNNEEGFEKFSTWTLKLMNTHKKTNVIVGIEPTGHYWFNLAEFLKKAGMKLVLVNPFHVKCSKELDDNIQTKTDQKDPKTIAGLVKEGRYLEPYIPESIYAELRELSNYRNRLLKDMNSVKNQIHKWLDTFFPEFKKVFRDLTVKSSIAVLKQAPLPCDVRNLGVDGINKIWRELQLRAAGIKRATSLCAAAEHTVGVTEGIDSARMTIAMIVENYERIKSNMETIEARMTSICYQIPAVEKLEKIKGVGIMTIACFLAEVGDISRFESPKQIQKLAGLALKECSSGKNKGKTIISKRGRPLLRKLLFQVAISLVANSPEFAELHRYYIKREVNPLKKKQSIIAISCKFIRVLFAILKNNVEYDPDKMINDIKRNNLKTA